MARYDIGPAWFKTPGGKSALMYIRAETNDWNTCYSSMNDDEYGLRGLELKGVALDIGAYLGSVSIAMLLDHPELRVVAVEPIPENVNLIWRNAVINSVADRLTVHEAAVGDGKPITIHYRYGTSESDLHHAFVGNSALTSGDVAHERWIVPTLIPSDFPAADFVKIDCEGGEWPFFAAGLDTRFGHIVGEWHPVDGGSQERLCALLPGHEITFSGPEKGPGGFRAVTR